MQFVFAGHAIYVEALLVALAAPSLQYLEANLSGATDHPFPIPQLYRFICDTDKHFNWVRFNFSFLGAMFTAGTCSGSVHVKPFAITYDFILFEEIGNKLSGPLYTVEELVVGCDIGVGPWFVRHVQWSRFFNHVQR